MTTGYWTVEVLRAGDPARLALGITTTDGFALRPVEVEVPRGVLEQGPAQVARYFMQQRRQYYVLRQALNLPASIIFSQ